MKITSIYISLDMKCFATSSQDGSVGLYNLYSGELLKMYYHPENSMINNVAITTSPLGAILFFSN